MKKSKPRGVRLDTEEVKRVQNRWQEMMAGINVAELDERIHARDEFCSHWLDPEQAGQLLLRMPSMSLLGDAMMALVKEKTAEDSEERTELLMDLMAAARGFGIVCYAVAEARYAADAERMAQKQ